MNEFFQRLKQRKLMQWAIAYVVAAFAFLQGIDIVAQQFGWPEGVRRGVTLALVVGFFVTLILAWYHGERGAQRVTVTELLIIALVLAVGGGLLWRFTAVRSPEDKALATPNDYKAELAVAIPEKSIAVLPFENRSHDPDNAYFADGIQDEILTRLSKIADLKVISRTSTQHYKSASGDLREIAEQLCVAYLLEGSVQKSGDAVRVNVQLIKAASDSHLWADTFDRKLIDIFSVESEIAKRIAGSLQAKLTGREEQTLAAKPTNNPEAYDAYLRGLAFEARFFSSFFSQDLEEKAISFFERAVQLDPNFALAWARLSRANAQLSIGSGATSVWRDAAKRALENAQKLEPNSAETLLALGYYQFWVLEDYGLAEKTLQRVSKMLPGSSEIPRALGLIARREGHWDQSVAYFEQALALDPRNVELLSLAAWGYCWHRQFPAALKLFDRALDITPNDPTLMAGKAGIYQSEGN